MCSSKYSVQMFHSQQWLRKNKKDQLQSLEMNNDFQLHLLTRGKLLCDRKKTFRNHLEKIHIDVPQKLNDFALQF